MLIEDKISILVSQWLYIYFQKKLINMYLMTKILTINWGKEVMDFEAFQVPYFNQLELWTEIFSCHSINCS